MAGRARPAAIRTKPRTAPVRGFARQRTHSNTLFLADMLMPTVSDLQIFIYSMDMDPDPEWGGCAGSSQQTFLHALQMIPEQAAGCSKHDHQYREGKNDRLLRDAARVVLLDRLLRLHALGVCELDNFAHFGFFPVFLPLCRFFCSSAVCQRSRLWLFSGVSGAW